VKQDILKQYKALQTSLKRERLKLRAKLTRIEAALDGTGGTTPPIATAKAPARRKRRMSAAGRAAIRAGAKARWAAQKAKRTGRVAAKRVAKVKKHFSPAARAALSAAAKARWAKVKAAGKARL
jgi:hypothetical protein